MNGNFLGIGNQNYCHDFFQRPAANNKQIAAEAADITQQTIIWLQRDGIMRLARSLKPTPATPASGTPTPAQIPSVQVVANYHRRLIIPCGPPTMMSQAADQSQLHSSGLDHSSAPLISGLHNNNNNNKLLLSSSSSSNIPLSQTRRGFATPSNPSQRHHIGGDLSAINSTSTISLLVWYKNDQLDTPIFVADARATTSGLLRDSRQVINADSLKGRAHVEDASLQAASSRLQQRLQQATLVIEDPQADDSGLYTCTLEFVAAPTRTHQVRVQVINPPQNMIIRDESSGELQLQTANSDSQTIINNLQQHSQSTASLNQPLLLGPFDENSHLNLICTADPGEPEAGQVSWWRPIDVSETNPSPNQPLHSKSSNSMQSTQTIATSWLLDSDANFMTTRLTGGPSSNMHTFIAFHKSAHQSSQLRVSLPYPTRLWTRLNSSSSSANDDDIPPPQETTINPSSHQLLKAELRLNPLKRTHLDQEFLCLAQNNKFSPPLNMTIKLNMNLKPLEVKIINKSSYSFQPEQKTAIECHIRGSKPAPKVRWLLGDRELNHQPTSSSSSSSNKNNDNFHKNFSETIRDMSRTEAEPFSWASHLTLVPQLSDHQQTLTCSAQNPNMPHEPVLSDTLVMDVQYAPQLTLQFGASIKPDSMRLGADVFMDCDIRSNPPSSSSDLVWLNNNQPLNANISAGIIMSNHTLVLQKIKLEQRGFYQCSSQNSVGRGVSNKLELKPKFVPQCDYSRTKRVYEVPLNQPVQIDCFVLAEPSDHVQFEWKFNKSLPASPQHQAIQQTGNGPVSSSSSSSPSLANTEYADFKLESLPSDQIGIGSSPLQTGSGSTNLENFVSEQVKQYETNFTQSYTIFRAESLKNSAGELQCRATNTIGSQQEPCLIQIIPYEIPLPVIGCFTDSVTSNSLSILCQPSAPLDGKLPNLGKVNYLLELYDDTDDIDTEDQENEQDEGGRSKNLNLDDSTILEQDNNQQVDHHHQQSNDGPKRSSKATTNTNHLSSKQQRNGEMDRSLPAATPSSRHRRIKHIVSETPSFHLTGLKPDRQYNAFVYAQSSKTRSPPTSLPARTLNGTGSVGMMLESTSDDDDSNLNSSNIEFSSSNNKRSWLNGKQTALEQQQKQSFAEKLITYLNVADYITLNGHSKQIIEISLIVLLCAITVALITFLVTNVCGSRSSSSSSRGTRSGDSNRKSSTSARIRVQVGDVSQQQEQTPTQAKSSSSNDDNYLVESSIDGKLETFDIRRPQLDSSIRLRPVSSNDPHRLSSNLHQMALNAGTGSDSSRETNTESTLITSQTTPNVTTSDSNPTTNNSNRTLIRNSLRNRTGSDLTRESLMNFGTNLRNNNKRLSIDKSSSLARPTSMKNYRASVERFNCVDHSQRDCATNGATIGAANFYTPALNQYDLNSDSPTQMLVLTTPASLSDSQPPDTPQCSLISGGSDCISGHELHQQHLHQQHHLRNYHQQHQARLQQQMDQNSIYVISNHNNGHHQSSMFNDCDNKEKEHDQVPTSYVAMPNQILRPASHSSSVCRLFPASHISFDSSNYNHEAYLQNNDAINCRIYNGSQNGYSPNCILPNSSSIPISLSNYARSPDPSMMSQTSAAIRRPASRQEISQLMQEVISGATLTNKNEPTIMIGNNYHRANQEQATSAIWPDLTIQNSIQSIDANQGWLQDRTLTVITPMNQSDNVPGQNNCVNADLGVVSNHEDIKQSRADECQYNAKQAHVKFKD